MRVNRKKAMAIHIVCTMCHKRSGNATTRKSISIQTVFRACVTMLMTGNRVGLSTHIEQNYVSILFSIKFRIAFANSLMRPLRNIQYTVDMISASNNDILYSHQNIFRPHDVRAFCPASCTRLRTFCRSQCQRVTFTAATIIVIVIRPKPQLVMQIKNLPSQNCRMMQVM